MTIPDGLPILSTGSHDSPRDGACIMEYVSILAGERFSDHPHCTDRVLAVLAQEVNDAVEDEHRQALLPLIPQLVNTRVKYASDFDEAERWARLAGSMLTFATSRRAAATRNYLSGNNNFTDAKAYRNRTDAMVAVAYYETSVSDALADVDGAQIVKRFGTLLKLWAVETGHQAEPVDLPALEELRQMYAEAR